MQVAAKPSLFGLPHVIQTSKQQGCSRDEDVAGLKQKSDPYGPCNRKGYPNENLRLIRPNEKMLQFLAISKIRFCTGGDVRFGTCLRLIHMGVRVLLG